ncbi:MAG: antibiotic biosynthesis monooxygenase [Candidatus Dormibacteraeota bacterium]|nr:antibiotic biosynthesis monooxygenase [Candidatus Dormibacteraeota bacterium]
MYIAISEVSVPVGGIECLKAAFCNRLGAVDGWPGFIDLEVLQDRCDQGRFLMVTRWSSKEAFRSYMRSPDHRRSHARIPVGDAGPRLAGFREYEKVAG